MPAATFTPIATAHCGNLRAWRYAYNDVGDIVGTSDAVDGGVNYTYDTAGRLLTEDYSPCASGQEDYSVPDLANGRGLEVLYHYDDISSADAPPSSDFQSSRRSI